jgi:HupE / UreJ protein
MMQRFSTALLFLVFWVLSATAPFAHDTTRSYLTLNRDGASVTAKLSMAFRDAEVAVWMDENLDGNITWAEATARMPEVSAYAVSGVQLAAGGPCEMTAGPAAVSQNGGIDYLDLAFAADCPDAAAPLDVRSRLFAEIDPDHRMFLSAITDGRTNTTVLSAASPTARISGDTGGVFGTFAAYVRAGIEHLAGGADHLIFLIVLMLPAVTGATGPRRAATAVVTAITGFTLAHALTLTAATLQILRPPSVVIEVLVAMSIVLTAADNIRPFLPGPRAAVAAAFGLIHGFGFATVLGGLNLTGGTLAIALLGFNIGIEAAQIAVVLAVMPALYMLRGGRWLLWGGSLAAMAAGLYWIGLRVFL